jgi:hypothetical protein
MKDRFYSYLDVMSQNNNFPSVNKIASTSSDELNNSNDDFPVVSNNGWANFDTFENNSKQNSQVLRWETNYTA